jgi:hypothetical protein
MILGRSLRKGGVIAPKRLKHLSPVGSIVAAGQIYVPIGEALVVLDEVNQVLVAFRC